MEHTEIVDIKKATQLLWHSGAMKLGSFMTKSSRCSPYFFDTSRLYNGSLWQEFVGYYVTLLQDLPSERIGGFFGAAYKGVPLVSSIAEQWYAVTGESLPFAFSRKEAKLHGEGGSMVGGFSLDVSAAGIVVCDDVLTSGRSLRQALKMLQTDKIPLLAAVVALDREERDDHRPHLSARQALAEEFSIPVLSVLRLTDVLTELKEHISSDLRSKINAYRAQHGPLS